MSSVADQAVSAAPERRTTRRRSESRRRLVAAARAVFAERGIRDTPVELICERAGFTRGAFYSNFASKEDLFLEVFRLETDERRRRFADVLGTVQDDLAPADLWSAREGLAEIVRAFVTTHTVEESWFVLMMEIRLQALRQPDLRARVADALQESNLALQKEIEQFATRMGVRLAVGVPDVVRAVLALYDDALEQNVLAGRPLTEDSSFLTEAVPRMLAGFVDWDAPAPGEQGAGTPGRAG